MDGKKSADARGHNGFIDLRSDTVTKPTPAMREAMFNAEVGDDVYGDDPTVNALETLAAKSLGKEAALFVPSGTFGNQLALFTHIKRGDEVILSEDSHIASSEAGAAAVIAGALFRTLSFQGQMPNPDAINRRIRRDDNFHHAKTGLICLENALGNGKTVPLDVMNEVYDIARGWHVPVHLDGARIFNAAAAMDVSPVDIAAFADSVMFCLSKGLCAPVGSMLCGTKDFIAAARRKRKLMGGGMRQAGVLAAPGIIAIKDMAKPERLREDHANAALLGRLLDDIAGVRTVRTDINMVFMYIDRPGFRYNGLDKKLREQGILINGGDSGPIRLMTHYWVGEDDVKRTADVIKEIVKQ